MSSRNVGTLENLPCPSVINFFRNLETVYGSIPRKVKQLSLI